MKSRISTAALYALLCLALVVTTALVAAPMSTNQDGDGPGVICVISTPSGQAFTISGAASYNGTTPWATADAPAGSYTISWEDLSGYTSPADETGVLDAGRGLQFEGMYTEGDTAPEAGTIGVTSNMPGATFVLSGAASYNGTAAWAMAGVPAGDYTIMWDNVTGFTAPDSENQTLGAGEGIVFDGLFEPAAIETGTIGVASAPAGATFTIAGPASFNGTAPWAVADAPSGDYGILWDNMTGVTPTPEGENLTLEAGGAIAFQGIYGENATLPEVGVISVTSAPPGAGFSIAGGVTYNGTTPWLMPDVPAGSYAITWENMTGLTAPSGDNQTLEAGEVLSFHGGYTAAPSEAGTMGVAANRPEATFTLSGPTSYNGTVPWAVTDAEAGDYTITWENITGYTAPDSEDKTLAAGEAINFFGLYQEMPPQIGTIGVTSAPAGGTFTLSGAASYNGTAPWAVADAPAGDYTIMWENMTGYDMTPSSENQTLPAEGAIVFRGVYAENATEPGEGTIGVNSNVPDAAFSLSGPSSYNGTVPWAVADAPAGSYTIMWDNITGYTAPEGESHELAAGEAVTFYGAYTPAITPPQTGVIGVIANVPDASFTISGAGSYNGTVPWAVDNATPGSYTIMWDNVTGYTKPADGMAQLAAGGAIIFDGMYTPAGPPPQGGTINVTSVPSGARFTITGAASYKGTAPWTVDNASPGTYTIRWGEMAGYATPHSATMKLEAGKAISFEGKYVSSEWTYVFRDPKRGTTLCINTRDKTFRFTGPRNFDSGVQKATWMQVQRLPGQKTHVNMYYRGQSFRVILHAHAWQDFCEAWVYKVPKVTLYRLFDVRGVE